MSNFIVIREYKITDIPHINKVIRNAYLSNVSSAWQVFVTKEITFQLAVICAAVMFIFVGIPFQYCILSLPIVFFIMYISVYLAVLMKAMEVTHGKPFNQCWVAESLEPYFSIRANPKNLVFRIIPEYNIMDEGIDMTKYRKKIVGTVSVAKFKQDDNAAWLCRLGVDKAYRRLGVAQNLIHTAEKWCIENRYSTVMCAVSECQEVCRRLLMNNRYLLKHIYHKQVIGTLLTLLMYQMECTLLPTYH